MQTDITLRALCNGKFLEEDTSIHSIVQGQDADIQIRKYGLHGGRSTTTPVAIFFDTSSPRHHDFVIAQIVGLHDFWNVHRVDHIRCAILPVLQGANLVCAKPVNT